LGYELRMNGTKHPAKAGFFVAGIRSGPRERLPPKADFIRA
jgi:hypothetical protein